MVKKIVIVGHDNYGAREIFTKIHTAYPAIEFLVIITKGLYYKKSYLQSIIKMVREASILFCLYRFVDLVKYRIKGNTLYSYAKKNEIPVYFTDDINNAATHNVIKGFAPDIVISTFTMHILAQSTIELSRIATIGCHPSILPAYRGLEVFFWVLANGETQSGVSIFHLDKRIDAGKVIMQEKFNIDRDDTVQSVYDKLTNISGELLAKSIDKFNRGESFSVIPLADKSSYFPMPTNKAYCEFIKSRKSWS